MKIQDIKINGQYFDLPIMDLLKPHLHFENLKDFLINEVLPTLDKEDNWEEYYEEAISDGLNRVARKYDGKLVSLDNVKKAILDENFTEKCDYIIKKCRANPDFDGDDTETAIVNFGVSLKEYIMNDNFENDLTDRFDMSLTTNITFYGNF